MNTTFTLTPAEQFKLMKSRAIILTEFLQLHDEVLKFKSDYDEPIIPPLEGKVICFSGGTYWKDYGCFGEKPGGYSRLGGAIVQYTDGTVKCTSPHDIVFKDPSITINDRRKLVSSEDSIITDHFSHWMQELPKTPFIKGDTVRLTQKGSDKIRDWTSFKDELLLQSVNYHSLNTTCDDGITPYPAFNVTPKDTPGGITSLAIDDLELVRRGNFYHYYHGYLSDLVFKDIKEEVSFARAIGNVKEARNPLKENKYVWDINDFKKCFKEGIVDMIEVQGGMFGSGPRTGCSVITDDDDLKARVREKIQEGFDISK